MMKNYLFEHLTTNRLLDSVFTCEVDREFQKPVQQGAYNEKVGIQKGRAPICVPSSFLCLSEAHTVQFLQPSLYNL